MIANYFMLDDISLKRFENLSDDKKIDKLYDVMEDIDIDDNILHYCDIDNMYDMLSFWLTICASNSNENELFNKFVFCDKSICGETFISYTKHKDLTKITEFIDTIDIKSMPFDVSEFKDKYKNIVKLNEEDLEFIKDELILCFCELRDMYNNAIKNNKNIIICVM